MMIYDIMFASPGISRTFIKVNDDGTVQVFHDSMNPADGPIIIRPGRVLKIDVTVRGNASVPVQYTATFVD